MLNSFHSYYLLFIYFIINCYNGNNYCAEDNYHRLDALILYIQIRSSIYSCGKITFHNAGKLREQFSLHKQSQLVHINRQAKETSTSRKNYISSQTKRRHYIPNNSFCLPHFFLAFPTNI